MVPARADQDAVAADQRHQPAPAVGHMPRRWTTVSPLACEGHVLELAGRSLRSISGWSLTSACRAPMQIGAVVHHPIRRAGTKGWRPSPSGRRAISPPRPRAYDVDGLGRHRARRKPRTAGRGRPGFRLALGESCRPGAGFLEPFRLLQNDDAKAFAASESAAVSPPIPAPATMMVRAAATERSGDLVLQDAFRRAGLARG